MRAFRLLPSLAFVLAAASAQATPSVVIDIATGEILQQEQATAPWFPASVSKLMTVYVALKAVREGRISLDTPLLVSARAARMAPSKMGFRPGLEVTLDNALKILMVKSANDVAVTVAEGIGGSVEGFAAMMNADAAALGMRESHWVNPNGLPDRRQVTSARDMALLGRALYRDFPDQAGLFSIGALQLGPKIMSNHNGLIGRYPGADGMKTGFTCAAGFNVVASATRGGRRLIAVVMGAPSARDRTAKAANLFDRAFAGSGGSYGNLAALPATGGEPPDMRGTACTRRTKGGSYASEIEDFSVPLASIQNTLERNPEKEFLFEAAGLMRPQAAGRNISALGKPVFDPVRIFVGRAPGWSGPAARAFAAAPAKTTIAKLPKQDSLPPDTARAFASPKPNVLDGSQTAVFADPSALPLDLQGGVADGGGKQIKQPVAAKPAPAKKQIAKLARPVAKPKSTAATE